MNNLIEICKKHAESKGGLCLSDKYINNHTKMLWKCSNQDHKPWEACYAHVVKQGTWCPRCIGRFSKEEKLLMAQKYAESKDGKCLSTEYINSKSKLEWKCSNKNHKSWFTPYSNVVKGGSWCPECGIYYYKEQKIRDLLEYFLKTKFPKSYLEWNINPLTKRVLELDGYSEELKLAFEFQGKHHYEVGIFNQKEEDLEYTKYKDKIKKENCKNNGVNLIIIDDNFKLHQKKEIIEYLLSLLKEKHIDVREKIKQEYIDNIFQKIIDQQKIYLLKAQEHAESKDGKCLSTEYISSKTPLKWKCHNSKHEIFEEIYSAVTKHNKWCPECSKVNIKEEFLDRAKEHAQSKGGECLSSEYINMHNKLKWKCNHVNHKPWFASFTSIIHNNTWCKQCSNEKASLNLRNKNGLLEAQEYAESKGGKCLSTNYINSNTKLEWKCNIAEHNSWFANFSSVVLGGGWCPECVGKFSKSDQLEKIKQYAKSKGGECLSNEFINSKNKLLFKCGNKDHKPWKATFTHIMRSDTWCRQCFEEQIGLNKVNKHGLKNAKEHAQSKGGECLSNEYKQAHEKLEWKCSNKNHPSWHASYHHVVNGGHWCSYCSMGKLTEKEGLEKAKNHAESRNGKLISDSYKNTHTYMKWECKKGHQWEAKFTKVVNEGSWCPHCREKRKK